MLLLNPKHPDRFYPDDRSRQIMLKTIAWFEGRGLKKIKQDDYDRTWYADFLDFVKRERRLNPPPRTAGDGARRRAACPSNFPLAP